MRKRIKTASMLLLTLFLIHTVNSATEWMTLGGNYKRQSRNTDSSYYDVDDIELLWSFETGGSILASPTTADINGDGMQEILIGSDDDILYALNNVGTVLWKYKTKGNVRSAATIDDIEGDGVREIIFGSDDGNLYVLDTEGKLKWSYDAGAPIRSSPAIADLGGKSENEIIFATMDGRIICLDAKGRLNWEYKTQGPITASPTIYDIDYDTNDEVIIGSEDNTVYVLKHPPHKVWRFNTYGDITGSVAINREGYAVFGSHDGKFYKIRIGSTGESITRRIKTDDGWGVETIATTGLLHVMNYTTRDKIITSAATWGVSTPKEYGFVFGSYDKNIYIILQNGTLKKRISVSKPIESSPALADLNGDNITDIIFGSNDGVIHVVNVNGSQFQYRTGGAIKSSPAIADIEGDGTLEFAVGSQDGSLYVFGDKFSMHISRGDLLYEKGVRYKNIGSLNEAEEYVLQAKKIYIEYGDTDSIKKCDDFAITIKAEELLRNSKKQYDLGDLIEADILLKEYMTVYSKVDQEAAILNSKRIKMLIEADTYVLEARYFYERGLNNNATIYANAAKNFYLKANDTKGLMKVEELMELLKTEGKAETYIQDGLTAREEGRVEDANMFFGFAKLSYQLASNEEGQRKIGKLIQSVDALKLYLKAIQEYNESKFEDAKKSAQESVRLYSQLEEHYQFSEKDDVVALYENIELSIRADELYEKAQNFYLEADYEKAVKYANVSMILYQQAGDIVNYEQAQDLYLNSITTHELIIGSGGERHMPWEAVVFSLSAFLIYLWKTGKINKEDVGGSIKYIINKIDGVGENENSFMHRGKIVEKKESSEVKLQREGVKPRFGRRVKILPDDIDEKN